MLVFLLIVGLLHQNQAAPRPDEPGVDVQMFLQEQTESATPSAATVVEQTDSSSSSSSSSSSTTSESSESSQSSEGTQQLRERLHQENMALEMMDSSQEISNDNSTGQWVNEPTLLVEETHHGHSDGGENSEDVEHQALLLNLHQLLGEQHTHVVENTMAEEAGDAADANQDVLNEGQVFHELRHSTERGHELTLDMPEVDRYHDYHGDEANVELSL